MKEYDSMIIECIGAVKNLDYKNTYIDLGNEYIEKYIINLKTLIYEEIKLKNKEYSEQLLNINNAAKIYNINKQFVEEKNNSKFKNETLINENNDNSNDIELNQLKEEEILEKGLDNISTSNTENLIKETKNIMSKTKNKIIILPLKININNEEELTITKEYMDNKNNKNKD